MYSIKVNAHYWPCSDVNATDGKINNKCILALITLLKYLASLRREKRGRFSNRKFIVLITF